MREDDGRDLLGKWAIVTGASSGLGADFVDILAGRGCSLIVVARRAERLEAQRERYAKNGVAVHALALNLEQVEAPERIYDFARERRIAVDFLINNAGFRKTGRFLDSSWEYDEAMLSVNVRALHHLTKLFLREMVARKSGAILNVASAAGFRPMGGFAAYAATKAYVLHLSEALNAEFAGTGVSVSALCPGVTRTEFFNASTSRGLMRFGMMESLPVARAGIDLMLRGEPFQVTGWMNRLMIHAGRFLPRSWVAQATLRTLVGK